MKEHLFSDLGNYTPGKGLSYLGLSIVPIVKTDQEPHGYISLRQAMKEGIITISEISQGGSVPNLKVENRGEKPVLLLAGEELSGAKQNRILNVTVLAPPKSELVIPVSCTEAGRWSYSSHHFEESGNVMPAFMKASIAKDVTVNLQTRNIPSSNQSKVWRDIDDLIRRKKTQSHTSAMADAFEHRGQDIHDIFRIFSEVLEGPGSCGMYVELDGRFLGMDLVSSPDVWKDLGEKILRSYVFDVVDRVPDSHPREHWVDTNQVFGRLKNLGVSEFTGVGLGQDLRLDSPEISGSTLMLEGKIIYLGAYAMQPGASGNPGYHSPRHGFRFF
ncbi:MAG: DUF6569 family protein [Candidatus Cloacimonadaceae bacterium]|jgi:hypothetical protein|nr:hypothetical protein [Candidatus Cloacimonadota bacterium]MDX9950261.1 hypothetical protein [Candidatus Syntrophosphaera sp.]NLN84701.1 hypothetical protein [Candidatus Cloacimonadota bacterium]